MTRLLFITENHPPDRGGMSESCDRILRGLARAGCAIDIVHFDRRAPRFSHRATGQGSMTRVPSEADAAHAINLLWNRLQQTVDLSATTHVVAFGGTMPLLAAPSFAAWIDRPLVTLIRGNELDTGLFDPRRRPILDDAIRRSAAICTVTRAQSQKIVALHPQASTHVVPNGIDFDLWHLTDADTARAAEWRTSHVEPSRRVLGMFGHLKSKKGGPFFLETLMRSGVEHRFHLLLVGEIEDSLQRALEEHAELHYTVAATVDRFALLPFYQACDLVVLPSHYDGFPNVLIEAAALGRPLLASAVGGMRDVLTDGEDAFLFAPGDVHACRDAIHLAASVSDSDLHRMGVAAAGMTRRHCDARDEARLYLEVLRSIQEVLDANDAVSRRPFSAPRRM